jgi:histidinol-phosphate/aromatic aminotransferase/cobyric acid decarboxylase-like protein
MKELIKEKIRLLKNESGTHSPSIATLLSEIPELQIKIDACFLSNPYATDLFIEELNQVVLQKKFRDILEYYPPQNYDVRKKIAPILGVKEGQVFVGNGAIEIIQACIHRFAGKKIALPIPTFSSYYEYALADADVVFYELQEDNDFTLDIESFSRFIKDNKADTAIIINPNNPVGNYLYKEHITRFLQDNRHLDLIVLDESFIHFAYENESLDLISNNDLIDEYPNLVIVKSMSKDFGIAGIRAGYGLMSETRVESLLRNGYLWNISGLADYFFTLYSDADFQKKYEHLRKKYIQESESFFKDLTCINKIKTFPTRSNFALIKIPSFISSFDFCVDLLIENGIYLRDCNDKIGLTNKGGFIRVASRSLEENKRIVKSIENYFK